MLAFVLQIQFVCWLCWNWNIIREAQKVHCFIGCILWMNWSCVLKEFRRNCLWEHQILRCPQPRNVDAEFQLIGVKLLTTRTFTNAKRSVVSPTAFFSKVFASLDVIWRATGIVGGELQWMIFPVPRSTDTNKCSNTLPLSLSVTLNVPWMAV